MLNSIDKCFCNFINDSLYISTAVQFNSTRTTASKMIVKLNHHLSATILVKTGHCSLHEGRIHFRTV